MKSDVEFSSLWTKVYFFFKRP